ncbi:VapA family S-layer protein [Photobacterium leiognathi]|uniref:VapA family S-layer protein n=1 Tax=Photobacterium leiognathi TaxID=553611 RepID=UPI0029827DDF|nr:hypothetical protein [Photobacterium leiognathi]
MFKKTLLAAAMTLAVAGQANAFEIVKGGDNITLQNVAIQSSAEVLQFQVGGGNATFDLAAGDVKKTNFVRLELTGGATWNIDVIRALQGNAGLVTSEAAEATEGLVNYAQAELLPSGALKLPLKIESDAALTMKVNYATSGVFNLTKATGDVKSKVALQDMNGSFVDEPYDIKKAAFNMVNVFEVSMDGSKDQTGKLVGPALINGVSTAEAKVKFQYKQFGEDKGATLVAPTLNITNNTSKQDINKAKITVTINGDFKDIDATSYKDWSVNEKEDAISLTLPAGAIDGGDSEPLVLPALKFSGENPIKAQEFTVDVAMASNATFNAYDVDGTQAYDITRDGFSFETLTTGTSAFNQIFIRDVSGKLPKEGAAINVRLTEYVNGEGKVIAETKALKTKLMNNGAVTLTPTQITDELGVAATPDSQARFEFFVETEEGRAAVKKQKANVGIDIQTADDRQQGNVL